jgi:hypothetical protein
MLLGLVVPCVGQEAAKAPGEQGGKVDSSPGAPADAAKMRRLETVTWNPVSEELTWVVSLGNGDRGSYSPGEKKSYVIRIPRATMTFGGETRGFSKQEADHVQVLIDVISRYAIESTLWWEHGQGVKLDDKGWPIPSDDDNKNPQKRKPPVRKRTNPGEGITLIKAKSNPVSATGPSELRARR